MNQPYRRFLQYVKRRFGPSSTLKHYSSDIHIFIGVVGDKAPEEVTVEDIDHFIEHQIAAGMSPMTINRRLSCIHSCFEFLAGEDPARDWPNPVGSRRHHLKTGKHLPRDVSDQDVTRLFSVIDDTRDQAIFGLMVGAGLRVGEVAALRLDSVEAPTEPVTLARLRVEGKGRKERVVWLSPSLWEVLQTWLRERPQMETDVLFVNRWGRPISISGIQFRLKQYSKEVGVTLSCHRLRHTFARRLVENGLPVDSLAKLLGHSQLKTTQRYIDGADPTVRADFTQAMAGLDTLLVLDQASPPEPAGPQPAPQPQDGLPGRVAETAPTSGLHAILDG